MNIITGYISASSGTVKVNGHDILEEPEEAKKCIGYLPEQPPLYPDMLVREYLNFVCDLKKVRRADKEKVMRSVMRRTGVLEVSGRLIKHLSKGYKQRVGLAGAMIGDPDILILDEPTVGLDPSQILEIRDLIRDLSKNHTILLSSHIMQEVSAVCNQILIINEGKLVVADRPEEIPKHIEQVGEITLVVKGNKEQICSAIENISAVENIQIQGDENKEELCDVTIQCPMDTDVREDIFYALAEVHCAILEMNSKTPTLEEAFIRLTGKGGKQ